MSRIVQANSLSLISQMMTIVLFATKNGMYFLLNDLVQAKVRPRCAMSVRLF